jgi:hypothetical protein
VALNLKLADAHVNAQADALNALYNGGKLRLYTGAQAATADTAIGAQVEVVEFTLPTPCFGVSAAGVVAANAISDVLGLAPGGDATWYRCTKADGTTGPQDGSVGTSGCNLNVDAITIVAGVTQHINSWSHTVPKV